MRRLTCLTYFRGLRSAGAPFLTAALAAGLIGGTATAQPAGSVDISIHSLSAQAHGVIQGQFQTPTSPAAATHYGGAQGNVRSGEISAPRTLSHRGRRPAQGPTSAPLVNINASAYADHGVSGDFASPGSPPPSSSLTENLTWRLVGVASASQRRRFPTSLHDATISDSTLSLVSSQPLRNDQPPPSFLPRQTAAGEFASVSHRARNVRRQAIAAYRQEQPAGAAWRNFTATSRAGSGRQLQLDTIPGAEVLHASATARPLRSVAPSPEVLQRLAPPAPLAYATDLPKLAIIIDDIGPGVQLARNAFAALPPQVSFAILPYADRAPEFARRAQAEGRDVILHLPMQPTRRLDPGPNALRTDMSAGEITQIVDWSVQRVPGAVAVNNHMGSVATADVRLMSALGARLAAWNLPFIDSRTTKHSKARQMATQFGLPFAQRKVFLDNDRVERLVERQLNEAIARAKRDGSAIAIGHPYPQTLAVLKRRIPGLAAEGVQLVGVSRVLEGGALRVAAQ